MDVRFGEVGEDGEVGRCRLSPQSDASRNLIFAGSGNKSTSLALEFAGSKTLNLLAMVRASSLCWLTPRCPG
jgi:hypothetical protein